MKFFFILIIFIWQSLKKLIIKLKKSVVNKIKLKKNDKSIKYSEFIKFLRNKFNKDISKFSKNIIIDCKIEYEDFLKLIISRNLNKIDSKHWNIM